MVETITPVVHGGRRTGWAASIALHALGATASAAALGGALGGAGVLLGAPWEMAGAALVALVALAYAARELLGVPVPIPERRRQVPEHWRGTFGPRTASFLYGVGLGPGFLTHIRHGTLVAVAGVAFASGNPLAGALLFTGFGLARSLAISVVGRAQTSEETRAVVDRLESLGVGRIPFRVNGIALVALATVSVASGTGVSGGWPQLAAALLAVIFAVAAASKALRPPRWRETVRDQEVGPLATAAVLGVPIAEATVALLVLLGRPAVAGWLAVSLLVTFSAAIVRTRLRRGVAVPCGCFGVRRVRDYRLLLLRNASIATLAVAALGAPAARGPLRAPGLEDALPVALVIAGIVLAAWIGRSVMRAGRPQEPARTR